MTTTATALVPVQPAFTDAERLALAGFLAGYRGLTREAYALDLRQFTAWCRNQSLPLFAVRRAGIESFARELRPGAGPGLPSPRGYAPSLGSTGTPWKKNFWIAHRPPTSAVREWTTSPTRSRWTVTSSARCRWPLGSARRLSMR